MTLQEWHTLLKIIFLSVACLLGLTAAGYYIARIVSQIRHKEKKNV